ncbi:mycofactocin precursor MftA [Aeromicrobium sp. CF3.5]
MNVEPHTEPVLDGEVVTPESLIEEVSIDGMCGVY